MKLSRFLFTLCTMVILASCVMAQEEEPPFNAMREWSNAEQTQTFKGRVLKYDGTKVTISPVGRSPLTMSIEKLSEVDRKWLEANNEYIGKPADEVKKLQESKGPVTTQLKKAKFLLNKPNTTAQYYIILYSASWCGACNKQAPKVFKLYNSKIKSDPKIELILASFDNTEDGAKKWAEQKGIKYPILMREEWEKVNVIKKHDPGFIPGAVLVDVKGEVLGSETSVAGYYEFFSEYFKK